MHRIGAIVAALALGRAAIAPGQSTLERGPNMGGTWTASGGVVQFNFIHRFRVSPAPVRKVINSPTFVTAVGLAPRLMVGSRYASNSRTVGDGTAPNEIEFFTRWRLLGGPGRGAMAVAVTPAWNPTARSVDAEVALDYASGPLTLAVAGRVLGAPYGLDDARFAVAGGLALRVNPHVALAADVAALSDASGLPASSRRAAWGAGLQFAVPGSPHTVSLHATNAAVYTLEGSSVGGNDVLYGFEFTIPIRLARFAPLLGGGGRPERRAEAGSSGPVAAIVEIRDFRFPDDTLTVRIGEAVRWVNRDPVAHSVTFNGGPGSSPLLQTGDSYRLVFDRAGVHGYHCTPHPFMRGVIRVVR